MNLLRARLWPLLSVGDGCPMMEPPGRTGLWRALSVGGKKLTRGVAA
jgi:hypothetical protein